MFTENKEIFLQVLPNKFIKIIIINTYFKNGSQIGQDTWSAWRLDPG